MKKKWTEKQIKEKIKEVKEAINRTNRSIESEEEELRDLQILLDYYVKILAEKRNNPSSVRFGAKDESS